MSYSKRRIEDLESELIYYKALAQARLDDSVFFKEAKDHFTRCLRACHEGEIKLANWIGDIKDAEIHDDGLSLLISMGLDIAPDENDVGLDKEGYEWMMSAVPAHVERMGLHEKLLSALERDRQMTLAARTN